MSRQRRNRNLSRIERLKLLDELKAEARTAWISGQRGHGFEGFQKALLRAESMDIAVWDVVEKLVTALDDEERLDDEGRIIVAEIAAPHLMGPKRCLRLDPRSPEA